MNYSFQESTRPYHADREEDRIDLEGMTEGNEKKNLKGELNEVMRGRA